MASPPERHLRSNGSVGSLGAVSSLGNLNSTKATKSQCSSMVLSHKSSAPSFSFGSGPARLQFTGAAARGPQTLQASVASGGDQSPGPIYNPAPARKWFGDAPRPHFGTQEQRPPTGSALSQEVSKLTGKSNTPGPGSYIASSSVGKQPLARSYSASSFSFGNQKQRESAAKQTPSPGPVYEPRGTNRGTQLSSAYSFGNEIRVKNRDPSMRTPGPGVYNSGAALGNQVHSTMRSGSVVGFGTPSANGSNRGILPLEGRHSPGPVYMNAVACRKQALSTKRSAPTAKFSRDDRFRGGVGAKDGPGPGEYII